MARAQRRKEEATAVDIRIEEHETLDSIVLDMVKKEQKNNKGKGKDVHPSGQIGPAPMW